MINSAEMIDARSTAQTAINFHANINQTMTGGNMTMSMMDDSREVETLSQFNHMNEL